VLRKTSERHELGLMECDYVPFGENRREEAEDRREQQSPHLQHNEPVATNKSSQRLTCSHFSKEGPGSEN
jgi:hypothetical protein